MKITFPQNPPHRVRWAECRYTLDAHNALRLLVGITDDDAICRLDFLKNPTAEHVKAWSDAWPKSDFIKNNKAVAAIFKQWVVDSSSVNMQMVGTAFQQAVWRALSKIPVGKTITYAELAQRIGRPKAVRAVGSACGKNPLPVIVPCHRVLASNGKLGGFGGGLPLKIILLKAEASYPPQL